MAGTPESIDTGLDQIAQYNAQEQYNVPHYKSPTPAMSPYSSYPDPVQMNPIMYASTPNATPSNPHIFLPRTTRSGRPIGSNPLGPQSSKVQKPISRPRPKPKSRPRPKSKKRRNERSGPPTVTDSLTITLAYLDPKMDTDIDAYVNRSVDVRQQEVKGTKDGKIKRPMNAFMLYRKGFQNRIKEHQKNENHQGVSKVAGDGWGLEDEHVRNQFNQWSQIERQMHAAAFPHYKFKPIKTNKASTEPGNVSEGDESELEDNWSGVPAGGKRMYAANDDPEGEYRPSGRVSNPGYGYQHSLPPSHPMSQQSPYQASPYQHHQSLRPVCNVSHYQYSNPHTRMPQPYPTNSGGHYLNRRVEVQEHQLPHPLSSYSNPHESITVEEVYYPGSNLPPPQYQNMSSRPSQHQHQQQQRQQGRFSASEAQQFYPDNQYQGQMHQSQYLNSAPGQYQNHHHQHRQLTYPATLHDDPTSQYVVPAPATPSHDAGVDNFARALGEMGGIFNDPFPLGQADLVFDPNTYIDTDGLIDPALGPNDWTTESLPPNALDTPDDFLDIKGTVDTVAAPEHALMHASSSAGADPTA